MFTLVHRDKMNMFSQKLKTRNIRTEAIDSLKLERINYLQEQIETVKKHIEELVTVAQSILKSDLCKECICVPFIGRTEDQQWVFCSGNKECRQKWFHFNCVRLLNKPKGSWYCPLCRFLRYQMQQQKDLDQNQTEDIIDDIENDLVDELIE